jgi:bifunctional non-homologous end joining protein LigD
VIVCRDGLCRIYSRNQREITGFPEVVAALTARVGDRHLVLDGELIAPDLDGAPSFGLLQRRLHVPRPSRALLAAVPAQLFLFDILAEDGRDLTGLPYLARRDRLQAWEFASAPVQTPPYWLDIAADPVLAVSAANHLEGISKRIDSAYLPGRRSRSWVKTVLRKQGDALVYGHTAGSGAMTGTFGALVLCAYDAPGRLVHIGSVGTGSPWPHAGRCGHGSTKSPARTRRYRWNRPAAGSVALFVSSSRGSWAASNTGNSALAPSGIPPGEGCATDITPASVRVPLD